MTKTRNSSPSVPHPLPDLFLLLPSGNLQRLSVCLYNSNGQFGFLALFSILRGLVKLYQNFQTYSIVFI